MSAEERTKITFVSVDEPDAKQCMCGHTFANPTAGTTQTCPVCGRTVMWVKDMNVVLSVLLDEGLLP
jgi:hypothetical protein